METSNPQNVDTVDTDDVTKPGESSVTFGDLKVTVTVGGKLVAESSSPDHWYQVLDLLTGRAANLGTKRAVQKPLRPPLADEVEDEDSTSEYSLDIVSLATEIGVTIEQLVGACDPSSDAPYMHLDHGCWEKMKHELPSRGRGAVANIVASATLLALWGKKIKQEFTQGDAEIVLKGLGAEDKNPERGLTNCDWLKVKGKMIIINPAQISEARSFMRKFCTKTWSDPKQ